MRVPLADATLRRACPRDAAGGGAARRRRPRDRLVRRRERGRRLPARASPSSAAARWADGGVAARELGAERVFAVDALAERLALAARCGRRAGRLPGGRSMRRAIRDATGGRGADAVRRGRRHARRPRASPSISSRPGGTIAAVGVHTEPRLAFAPGEAYDKNLTYRAGRCPARAYIERLLAARAIARRYDLGRMISHRLPLDRRPARVRPVRPPRRRAARRWCCCRARRARAPPRAPRRGPADHTRDRDARIIAAPPSMPAAASPRASRATLASSA